MANRTAGQSAATRELLLDATIACLSERGYHGTSTNDVVARAKSSRGALLHHFPSRKELFAAAAHHLAGGWLEAMQGALAASKVGEARVAAGIRMFRELVATPEFNAFLELTIAARTDDDLRAELLALRTAFIETAETFTRALFPDLAAASPDFAREFRAGIHFLEGLALSHTITRDARAIDDQLRYLFETRVERKANR